MRLRWTWLLLALGCVVLLSSSAYIALRTSTSPDRPGRPPIDPSVQETPDLAPRFQQLREAAEQDDAATTARLVLEIARFHDAGLPAVQAEALDVLKDARAQGFSPASQRRLLALLETLGRIASPSAQRAFVTVARDVASAQSPTSLLASATSKLPRALHRTAMDALLAALRVADDASAIVYLDAIRNAANLADLPLLEAAIDALPDARRAQLQEACRDVATVHVPKALVKDPSLDTAERLLLPKPSTAPPNVPPEAAALLPNNTSTPPATGEAAVQVVRWIEGRAQGPEAARATLLLERVATEAPSLRQAAAGALVRVASGGGTEASAALSRLHRATPQADRPALVEELILYATRDSAALLELWASDPDLPQDLRERAAKVIAALRAGQGK